MYTDKTIIFDFDGTIADSFNINFNIYNELAEKYKCKTINEKEREELRNFRPQEILKKYGVTKLKLPLLLMKGRRKLQKMMSQIPPIKGICEALNDLKLDGFKIGILTSNSKKNVKIFLKNNNLEHIFEFVHTGKHLFGKNKSIKRILKKKKISSQSVIYVGDETRDVEATKKAKVPIVAVGWGYNTPKILSTLNPEKLVKTPKELTEFLRSHFASK